MEKKEGNRKATKKKRNGEGLKGEGEKKEDDTANFPRAVFVIRMDHPTAVWRTRCLTPRKSAGDEKVYDDTVWTLSYLEKRRGQTDRPIWMS